MFGRLLGWYTICTLSGDLPPNGILQGAKFTLRSSLALSYIASVTARHRSSGRQPNFGALSRGCHLYSAGRPWIIMVALCNRVDHIYFHAVVCSFFFMVALCNRADHYMFILFLSSLLFFFFLSFFPRLISVVRDWMFTILWHMVWP